MEVENSVALGDSCDADQRHLVDVMPPLALEAVTNFVSFNKSLEQHTTLASSIIANRYTYYGWKDYMYCYIHCAEQRIEYVVSCICSLARSSNLDPLLYVFKLLYSPTLVMVTDAEDRYNWRYFNGRLWMKIDKMQLRGMFYARCESSQIGSKLSINLHKHLHKLNNMLLKGDAGFHMFASNFESDVDNKETTFCMKSCTYDMSRGILRRQLPGDLCTLAGDVDPDGAAHTTNRAEMLGILSTWLDGEDVAASYLDILANALGEFGPRYAVVNSGTGADGKSTFTHIIARVFGSLCMTMPSAGPSVETKQTNDATPVASAMMGKRVFITTDASNIGKVLTSSGFKAISGGDTTYVRRLYREASTKSPRLKGLVIINTNENEVVATSISDLTRLRIFMWLHKRISDEDRDIIPKHQGVGSGDAIQRFEEYFIDKLGPCLMMELISRHVYMKQTNTRLSLCARVRQWTKDLVAPKTIIKFVQACCVYSLSNILIKPDVDEATAFALTVQSKQDDASIEDLFIAYAVWHKRGGRFSSTDPNNLKTFAAHLEFYYPISKRFNAEGVEEIYIRGLALKPEMEQMSLLMGGRQLLPTMQPTFGATQGNVAMYTYGARQLT